MNTLLNLAQLRSFSNFSEPVYVQGYMEVGDGGHGIFYWDATNIEPDNDGVIIKENTISTGRWVRSFSGNVNVLWFGPNVVAQSNYHCTEAFQAAIDFVSSKNLTLFIPNGEYIFYKVTPFKNLANGGSYAMNSFSLFVSDPLTINAVAGATLIFDNGSSDRGTIGGIASTSDLFINGLTFKIARTSNSFFGRIINIEGTSSNPSACEITNCTFIDSYTQLCLYNHCANILVANCTFLSTGNSTYGILSDDCRGLKNVNIVNNIFEGGIDGGAIELNNDGLISSLYDTSKAAYALDGSEYTTNVSIYNNVIANYTHSNFTGGIGIGIAGPAINVNISANNISNCNYGIHMEYFNVTVKLPLPLPPLQNVIISDNNINNIIANPAIHLLGVNGDRFSPSSQILIIGNNINNLPENQLAIQIANTNGAEVLSNKIGLSVTNEYYPSQTSGTIGIYVSNVNNINIKSNTFSKFQIGFMSSGGVNSGASNTIANNTFIDCWSSYYLDEFTATMGNLFVKDNKHDGCYSVFDCVESRDISLIGHNETIVGNLSLDFSLFAHGGKPMGLSYSYNTRVYNLSGSAAPQGASTNFSSLNLLVGHLLVDHGDLTPARNKIVTDFGMMIGSISLTVSSTPLGNIIHVESGDITTLSTGTIIEISGVLISTPLIVVKVDYLNNLIYLNENVEAFSSQNLIFKYASF